MENTIDFIDNPLSCLETGNPVLVLSIAELVDGNTQIKLLDYFIQNLSDKNQPYLTGYALYLKACRHQGSERSEILENAVGYFLQSTSRGRNKIYARAYLVFSYYDLGKFRDALNAIKDIPDNYFARKRQKWRDLLIRQIKICCLIRLGEFNHLEDILYDYFVLLTHSKEIDVCLPTEWVETLKSVSQPETAPPTPPQSAP